MATPAIGARHLAAAALPSASAGCASPIRDGNHRFSRSYGVGPTLDPAPAVFWTAAHGRQVDAQVLHRVLGRAQEVGARGLVLFDLDSTLLDNKPRQARILREFGAAHGAPS